MTTESPPIMNLALSVHQPGDPPPRRHVVMARRRLRPAVVVSTLVLLLVVSSFVRALVIAPTMQWSVVWHYLFDALILEGLLRTIELTLTCEVLAVVTGGILAWLLISGSAPWHAAVHAYQWFFRSVPELAQLIFWFNLSLLFPRLKFGIPFGGPVFGSLSTNAVVTPWIAAVIGIGLHEGAYLAEVFRSGISSVDPGQREASQALGLSPGRTFRKVIFPQAMWVIVPNAGSRLIGTLKITSLASVLAIQELLYTTETIYSRTFQTIPLLLVATVWYMVCVALLRILQHRLERHYARSARGVSGARLELTMALPSEDMA